MLTIHGANATQLLYTGQGQAIKAGGNKGLQAILTPLYRANKITERGKKGYLCYRSLVGLVDQFTNGKKNELGNTLERMNTLYARHMQNMHITQIFSESILIDNVIELAVSIRYPICPRVMELEKLESSIVMDNSILITNRISLVLRRFILLALLILAKNRPNVLIYLHIVVECGIYLLSHKFRIPYSPNPQTLSLFDDYVNYTDEKQVTKLMSEALGCASQCVALLENRSSCYLQQLQTLLVCHVNEKAAYIVQSYIPTFI
jgi:hypothetical protein